MKNRYAITDIHGCSVQLKELLHEVSFNYNKDELICIGDVCDRGPNVKDSIDELMKIKNLIYILGNHDFWTLQFFKKEIDRDNEDLWWKQGGKETYQSFKNTDLSTYINFLEKAKPYYIDSDNRIFVHGGFDPDIPIEKHSIQHLIWDRDLIDLAEHARFMHIKHGHKNKISNFSEIFIGHTPTTIYGPPIPINILNLWAIDTGCVYGGKLTLINIDTKQYWQTSYKKK